MDNLKKYNDYILDEMIIINKPEKEPLYNFTSKEINALNHCEGYKYDIVLNNKAICQVLRYRISIYKRGVDNFLYRVRDTGKSFNPIILENRVTSLLDCLRDLDSFMYDIIMRDKEQEAINKKLEKERLARRERGESDIFAGKSFSGKGFI